MSASDQRTIAREVSVSGIGLHSGEPCTATFRPAPADHGIVFVRTDLPGEPRLRSHPSLLCQRQRRTALATTVAGIEVEVHTCEHLLSACQGLSIDNLEVRLTAVELPGMDGSANDFVAALREAGISGLVVPRKTFAISQAISVSDGRTSLIAMPWTGGLKITYTLDDHGGALGGAQVVEIELGEESFARDIAPARTFCMAKEVEYLRSLGLGKGAHYQNTCVYDGNRIIDNELRFKDEAARHKVLDLIGDLAHVSRRLSAHIIAVRSGHRENLLLVQALNKAIEESEKPRLVLDIQAIMARLPHRFPMLLIDRVLELELSKRLVAIKNVTANEPFFQGHFPGRPVMPGVLLIEAMAQAAAVLILSDPEHAGRIPFFMSIESAKFRRPVVPGDQIRIEVDVLRLRSRMGACACRCIVDGEVASEAEIRSVLMDPA